MGSWIYKIVSESHKVINSDGEEITVGRMYRYKERYIYNWWINPVTKIWEQDPSDLGPTDKEKQNA